MYVDSNRLGACWDVERAGWQGDLGFPACEQLCPCASSSQIFEPRRLPRLDAKLSAAHSQTRLQRHGAAV